MTLAELIKKGPDFNKVLDDDKVTSLIADTNTYQWVVDEAYPLTFTLEDEELVLTYRVTLSGEQIPEKMCTFTSIDALVDWTVNLDRADSLLTVLSAQRPTTTSYAEE